MTELVGKRILLLEDEYFVAHELKRHIDAQNATLVGPFPTAREGLNAIETEKIDAAVLDVELRDGSVFDLARILQKKEIPFIFVTGLPPQDLFDEFRDIEIVSKPIDEQRLLRALMTLLR